MPLRVGHQPPKMAYKTNEAYTAQFGRAVGKFDRSLCKETIRVSNERRNDPGVERPKEAINAIKTHPNDPEKLKDAVLVVGGEILPELKRLNKANNLGFDQALDDIKASISIFTKERQIERKLDAAKKSGDYSGIKEGLLRGSNNAVLGACQRVLKLHEKIADGKKGKPSTSAGASAPAGTGDNPLRGKTPRVRKPHPDSDGDDSDSLNDETLYRALRLDETWQNGLKHKEGADPSISAAQHIRGGSRAASWWLSASGSTRVTSAWAAEGGGGEGRVVKFRLPDNAQYVNVTDKKQARLLFGDQESALNFAKSSQEVVIFKGVPIDHIDDVYISKKVTQQEYNNAHQLPDFVKKHKTRAKAGGTPQYYVLTKDPAWEAHKAAAAARGDSRRRPHDGGEAPDVPRVKQPRREPVDFL